MALPPYLMTIVLPWNLRMYGNAWARISALSRGATYERSCVAAWDGGRGGHGVGPRRASQGVERAAQNPTLCVPTRRCSFAIDEPARSTPVFGEYDVVVLGGGPGRHRRGGIGGAPRRTHAARRALRLSRRHGHRRRRDQLLRPARQRARRDSPGRARRRRRPARAHAGARRPQRAAPHLRQDPRAGLRHGGLQVRRRCAAADLRRRASVPRLRGRRERDATPAKARSTRSCSRRSPAALRCERRCSSDCSGDGDLAHFAGLPMDKGGLARRAALSDLDVSRRQRRRRARRRRVAHDPRSHGRGRGQRPSSISRAAARSCGRKSTPTNGAST